MLTSHSATVFVFYYAGSYLVTLYNQYIAINGIESRVFLPLGACLDFYMGSVYRGSRWMTDRRLEWLTRLVIEPQRLWERYMVGNPLFFYRFLREQIVQGARRRL